MAKRGLLQRMNPLNLFRGEDKKEKGSTTASGTKPTVPSIETNLGAATNAEPPPKPVPPPKPLPRYTYLSPATPAPGNRVAAAAEFTRGLEAQRTHNLAEAIQAYRAAIKTDPSFFEAQYDLGLAECEAGQVTSALVTYETALAIRPDSVDGRYNFALALKQANYPVDAANEMEKVVADQPNDVRAHLMLGLVYAQQLHKPEKARLHYLKVLELDPQNSQASAIRYWLASNP
jgi:tetratricopeptide (TPR) repeat protein